MEIRNTTCCGVKEFYGLASDPSDTLWFIAKEVFEKGLSFAFMLFTDPVEFKNGETLKDAILELKLGTVTETPEVENPNSQRILKAYLFSPDMKAFKAWYVAYYELIKKLQKCFKVGDRIIGTSEFAYTVTKKGWTGEVVDIGIDRYITVRGGNQCYSVDSQYFMLH